MAADDAGRPPQAPNEPAPRAGLWQRIVSWDREFSIAKGLAVVTLLTSVFGGYFQYLNAYQDKVSTQARDDMNAATSTFMEISNALSQIQALQRLLYSDFTSALKHQTDANQKSLDVRNAKDVSDDYEKARTALSGNINVLARKAEIYIDWSSDIGRDAAAKHNVDDDPLTSSKLRAYDFHCADPANFPRFGDVNFKPAKNDKPPPQLSDEEFCRAGGKQDPDAEITPGDAYIRICPPKNDKRAIRIYWYSAKHEVLTMQYCLEAAHDRLAAVRDWASGNERNLAAEQQTLADAEKISAQLDGLATRLNAFTSLALSQMERIRVKYRPAGFVCSVPFVRDLFVRCFPIHTASTESP
jgi:hypothetical protein